MTSPRLLEDRQGADTRTDEQPDPVRAHRPVVVRRLLDRGLSPATIDQLLPGWGQLADE